MKRYILRTGSLLLVLMMLLPLMCAGAFATNLGSFTADLPTTKTVTEGDSVTLYISFSGQVQDVQWYRNDEAVYSGSGSYTFTAKAADNGAKYYATVLDSSNYIYTSTTCTLTVNSKPQSTEAPQPTEAPQTTQAPQPTATPAPTASPEPTLDPNSPPKVTKDPTGETVTEGDYAIFIARADNATDYIWRLVSADKNTTIECKDASRSFPGLYVEGLGTERIVLSNIPLELNGWKVECKFVGPGGNAFSKGALLTVKKAELKPPTLVNQPSPFTKVIGEEGKLSVRANENNAGDLNFQWYCSSTDSNTGGTPIAGATTFEFTPPQTEGTLYYYVEIWSTKGELKSEKTVSVTAAVSYTQPEPEPTPTPLPTEAPIADSETQPENSSRPEEPVWEDSEEEEGSATALIIFLVIAVLVALGAVAALLIVNKRMGSPKAAPAVQYVCDNCGWEPSDPNFSPRYCPNCGELFDAEAPEEE